MGALTFALIHTLLCINIYTDEHCFSHSVSLLVTLACLRYMVFDRRAGLFKGVGGADRPLGVCRWG
jgi:hypothetical protein